MRALRATAGAALLLAGTLAATPAVAAARWGLDVGAQWSNFSHTSVAVADFPDAPYRVATFTGGIHHERRVNPRLALGTSLRYDEWAAGQQFTLFPFSGLPSATVELEFQELVLAPSVRFEPGRGFGIFLGPEVAFVLRTMSREALGVSPASATGPRKAEGAIFEQAGTLGSREVTAHYRRWLPAIDTGLSWEHSLFGHDVRWSTEYRHMLQHPSRNRSEASMSAWRAGLTFFP